MFGVFPLLTEVAFDFLELDPELFVLAFVDALLLDSDVFVLVLPFAFVLDFAAEEEPAAVVLALGFAAFAALALALDVGAAVLLAVLVPVLLLLSAGKLEADKEDEEDASAYWFACLLTL